MSSRSSDPLARVRRVAAGRRRAQAAYVDAIVAAVDELEAAGEQAPYARVAAAAGVSRQAVRELVTGRRTIS